MDDIAGTRAPRVLLSLFAFFIATTCFAFDQYDVLSGEFWVELDPRIKLDGENYPLTPEDAAKSLLEEARFAFSGMIYGFEFVYTPFDKAREVLEIFELEAVAEIPWGDPALSIVSLRESGSLQFGHMRYAPEGHQVRWIQAWESNVHPRSTGIGEADLFRGTEQKREAVREAVKEAIREYLRPRILNKPKEIRGEAVFVEAPYVFIDSGFYRAKVSVKLRIDKIVPYRQY